MTILWVSFAVALTVAVTMAYFLRMAVRPARGSFDAHWLESFRPSRYRPMERLLDDEEFAFLKSQPGFHPSIAQRLRKQRVAIFRQYLRQLKRDFQRLQEAGRLMVLYSEEDRPDLAKALMQQDVRFRRALLQVHIRLALYRLGIGKVDVRGLVGALETVSHSVRMPAPNAAQAWSRA
ncbi:MAG: hypothetical protein IRZ15_01725 [Bryobacteraceae bacterium]|mgnify:CR=1 FL=1|jgi:hypothetical protein|nr:hypothetical protein [Bryobacteraceae bacterium]